MYQKIIGTYTTQDGKESGTINGLSDDGFSKVKVAIVNGIMQAQVDRGTLNRKRFKIAIIKKITFELGLATQINFKNGWK